MKHLPLLVSTLALCATVCAQSKVVSSPPGFETKSQLPEDRTWGYRLGQYADERFQAADGQFRNRVLGMKEISYRLDQRDYKANSTSGGVGKTWANVTLSMSDCEYDKMTSTFSTNSLTTPTRVFSSSVTWATQVGFPASKPAAWGGNGIKFPFTTTWIHTGNKDFLLDYMFAGGKLANGGAWTKTTSKRYYLDGFYSPNFALGSQTDYPPSPNQTTPPNCVDSAWTPSTSAARNDIQGIFVYNTDHATRPNQIYLQWRSFFTAPSKPVIKAWGIAGIPKGFSVGAACNKLYLDVAMPHFLIGQTAGSTGKSPFTFLNAPFAKSLGGVSLWFQCAWTDSKSLAFSLTTTTERKVPLAIPPVGPRRKSLYTSDPSAVTGTGPNLNGSNWGANPMYLITYN